MSWRPIRSLLLAGLALASGAAHAGEVIREQDAGGRVHTVREVAEDAAGNCVNHGVWQMYSPDGRLAAEGCYERGLRSGVWRRWLTADAVPVGLSGVLRGFEAPFVSKATFVRGRLEGAWVVTDALGRLCLTIEFASGERHGRLEFWAPTGELVRRESYDRGRIDGASLGWLAAERRLVHVATFREGYRLVRSVAFHAGAASGKQAEGQYLVGPHLPVASDDFWESRLAEYRVGNQCLRHGAWRYWRPGGQLAMEGQYEWGLPVGEFIWRHPNGQKLAAGRFASAGRPEGVWRWWNADGAQVAVRTVPDTRETTVLAAGQNAISQR